MSRGSSRKADKLREKRNRPPDGEPWVWFTRELLESDAWRYAPINTRRVVERIMLEHMANAGTMNGDLIVTYIDFEKYGIGERRLSQAIKDAIRRGLIDRTQQGRASYGLDRWPSKYALGWLPRRDGAAALNRWKAYKLQKLAKCNFSPTRQKTGGQSQKSEVPHPTMSGRFHPTKGGVAFSTNRRNPHPTNVGYYLYLG